MTTENYLNIDGLEMVLIIEDNQAISMTKAEYDRRQVEHLTEIVPSSD